VFKINTINHVGKSKQGMTFVEVLVTIVILSVVIGGSIAVFAKCNIFANEIREHSIANNALNEEMEKIRGMNYNTILNLGTTFTTTELSQLDNVTGSLTLDDPFIGSNIRRVTLIVNWTTPLGRLQTKSLAALVTNSGINRK